MRIGHRELFHPAIINYGKEKQETDQDRTKEKTKKKTRHSGNHSWSFSLKKMK